MSAGCGWRARPLRAEPPVMRAGRLTRWRSAWTGSWTCALRHRDVGPCGGSDRPKPLASGQRRSLGRVCGRIAVYRPTDVLAGLFGAREGAGVRESCRPSFNLAPTRMVVGLVVGGDGERVLHLYRWGLRHRLFNARAESVATNGAFAGALRARRLAVLADGFFEWQNPGGGRRQPFFFARADGEPLALAGLWDREGGSPACTVITTNAGNDLAGIHDRMPVILERDTLARWLDRADLSEDQREAILRPAPAGTLVHHRVDPRVGDVRNDDPDLIEPFDPPAEPLQLFG